MMRGSFTIILVINYLPLILLAVVETDKFLRPFLLRAESTLRPLAVAILSRKPCLFLLLRFDGWYVLYILFKFYLFVLKQAIPVLRGGKYINYLFIPMEDIQFFFLRKRPL